VLKFGLAAAGFTPKAGAGLPISTAIHLKSQIHNPKSKILARYQGYLATKIPSSITATIL
jgi:hypothetical protein